MFSEKDVTLIWIRKHGNNRLVFLEKQGKEITLNRFNNDFLDLSLPSKAIYHLPKVLRASSPSISLSIWDRPVLLYPYPSSFNHTVWVLKAPTGTNEQNCPLSQWPTSSGTQSPTPSPYGRGHRAGIVFTVSGRRSQKLTLSINQGPK